MSVYYFAIFSFNGNNLIEIKLKYYYTSILIKCKLYMFTK